MKRVLLFIFCFTTLFCSAQQKHFSDLKEALKQPENVYSLRLYNREDSVTVLPSVLLKFPNLNKIELNSYDKLDYAQVFTLLSKISNLDTLIMYNCIVRKLPDEIGLMMQLKSLKIWSGKLEIVSAEIGKLNQLEILELMSNDLNFLPTEIGKLSSLKELYLSNNKITELPQSIIELKNLQKLMLWSNSLTSLPNGIEELTGLRTLSLGNNKLKCLPININKLLLENLYLNGNNFKKFPFDIFEIKTLKSLLITGLTIDSLPSSVKLLNELETIELGHLTNLNWSDAYVKLGALNNLRSAIISPLNEKEIPYEINALKSLRNLTLKGFENSYEVIMNVSGIENLERLHIDHYRDSILPPSIGQMKLLKFLTFTNSQIQILPIEIGELIALEELHVAINGIQSVFIPNEIGNLQRLRILDLTHCKVKELPTGICDLVSLEELLLNGNKLKYLPDDIGKLKSLEKLNVSDNSLKGIPISIGQLNKLSYLNLSWNKIGELPLEIYNLSALESLNVSDCDLSIIDTAICNLTNLIDLDFSHNINLRFLPDCIGGFYQLMYFNIECTQIKKLPSSILINESVKSIRFSNNLIKNRRLNKNNYPNIYFVSYSCEEIERLTVDFDKKYGKISTWMVTTNDTIELHYKFEYNEPGIDDEYIQGVIVEIAQKDIIRDTVIKLPNDRIKASSLHRSVWDFGSGYEDLIGEILFLNVKKKSIRAKLNLGYQELDREIILIDNKKLFFHENNKKQDANSIRDIY